MIIGLQNQFCVFLSSRLRQVLLYWSIHITPESFRVVFETICSTRNRYHPKLTSFNMDILLYVYLIFCIIQNTSWSFCKLFTLFLGALISFWLYLNLPEPVHEISNKVVCATSKASDQPAHTRSLIRAFTSRLTILWLLSYWLNTIWRF